MRAPYIFEQYNTVKREGEAQPSIEGLARDLVIYLAWNRAENVILNAREFGKLFGYSHAYLYKKCTPEQTAWLKHKGFNTADFKDLITYTLAKLYIEVANFPQAAPMSYPVLDADSGKVLSREESYEGLQFITKATVSKSFRGTTYTFRQNQVHIINCATRYRCFDLNEYLMLKSTSGKAWTSGRRMFMHLVWKRGAWDSAIENGRGRGHERAQLVELLRVAGLNYADEKRQIHELRGLLDDLSLFADIMMTAEIKLNDVGVYEVEFTRLERQAVEA
jgi:hypothetical protein